MYKDTCENCKYYSNIRPAFETKEEFRKCILKDVFMAKDEYCSRGDKKVKNQWKPTSDFGVKY